MKHIDITKMDYINGTSNSDIKHNVCLWYLKNWKTISKDYPRGVSLPTITKCIIVEKNKKNYVTFVGRAVHSLKLDIIELRHKKFVAFTEANATACQNYLENPTTTSDGLLW